jgi:hypothetical protein
VEARSQYNRARTNLRSILGTVLTDYEVDIEQAKTGTVGREPDLIPAAPAAAPASSPVIQR